MIDLTIIVLLLAIIGLGIYVARPNKPSKKMVTLNVGKSTVITKFIDDTQAQHDFVGETKMFNTVWSSKNKALAFVDCPDPMCVSLFPAKYRPRSLVKEYVVTHEDWFITEPEEKFDVF